VTPKLYFENKMSFKFENLRVGQLAMDLDEDMDSLADQLHKK
jgi:hypothetical protein